MNATWRGRPPRRCTGVALSRFLPLKLNVNERPRENDNVRRDFEGELFVEDNGAPFEIVAATPRITSIVAMLLCATPERTRSTWPSAVVLPLALEYPA